MSEQRKHIYIVISQTGTILSRIIKLLTKAEYNHASIGLSKDLDVMYSFGRLNPYNPFIGGFVKESPHYGTFKRFKNTTARILEVDVGEKKYEEIATMVESMWENRNNYDYNYRGLFVAAIRKPYKKKDCFYCSEFVKHILVANSVENADKLSEIIHPMEFLKIPHKTIYTGKLSEYAKSII